MTNEHPLTGLTAFSITLLLVLALLAFPKPLLSKTGPTPGAPQLEPATAIAEQPNPPADKATPDPYGTREPPTDDAKTGAAGLTERVAKALGLEPAALTLISATSVTWSDGCLGCPQPGEQCLQVLTPGQQVIYQGPGAQRYDVRTGQGDHFIICQATTKSEPAPTAAPRATAVPGDRDDLLDDALAERVAKALGLDPQTLTRVSSTGVTWSNGCLDCPQPGEQCLQVLVPGQQVIYQGSSGQRYDVRTGQGGQFVICQAKIEAEATAAPAVPALPTARQKQVVVKISYPEGALTAERELQLQPVEDVQIHTAQVLNGSATVTQVAAEQLTVHVSALPAGEKIQVLVTFVAEAETVAPPVWNITGDAAGLNVDAAPMEPLDLTWTAEEPRRPPLLIIGVGIGLAGLLTWGALWVSRRNRSYL